MTARTKVNELSKCLKLPKQRITGHSVKLKCGSLMTKYEVRRDAQGCQLLRDGL